jgi:hypothetical protein
MMSYKFYNTLIIIDLHVSKAAFQQFLMWLLGRANKFARY